MKSLIPLVLLAGSFSANALDLGDALNAVSGGNTAETKAGDSQASSGLLSTLTSQLGVSDTQAAGGTAALMSLAKSGLEGNQYSQLTNLIPGMQSNSLTSQLLGQVTDMPAVKSAFSTLGMDPALVSQFVPVITQYLASNGGSELIGSLTKLWAQ